VIQDYYNPQDLNRYSYAWNNPLRITDPTGHFENSVPTGWDNFYGGFNRLSLNPYFDATATFSQAFLTAPFTMPYRLGYSTGEIIDSLFNSPASWMARGDTPPGISSMVNAFNAGNPNPAISMLGTAAGDLMAFKAMGSALGGNKLSYDISNWKDYGLPSDGYFSRMISKMDAKNLVDGRTINLAGDKGAGFIGSAEELRNISTGQGMKQAMGVSYTPNYLLEFQLKDVTGLQNLIKYNDPMWQSGGKTITGFSEYSVPGLNSDMIMNWYLRGLK
jgi:hypothetical protein